jgi:hypothetical protein
MSKKRKMASDEVNTGHYLFVTHSICDGPSRTTVHIGEVKNIPRPVYDAIIMCMEDKVPEKKNPSKLLTSVEFSSNGPRTVFIDSYSATDATGVFGSDESDEEPMYFNLRCAISVKNQYMVDEWEAQTKIQPIWSCPNLDIKFQVVTTER